MTITGRLAADSACASSAIAALLAVGCAGNAATAGGSALIVSISISVGTETNTGPRGALIASWQARWMVCGRINDELRPKLHFTVGSTRRAGPPRSVSTRSHCRPAGGAGASANEMDSPAMTTMGMRSCSAARIPIVACSAPTVVCSTSAGSLPVAFA